MRIRRPGIVLVLAAAAAAASIVLLVAGSSGVPQPPAVTLVSDIFSGPGGAFTGGEARFLANLNGALTFAANDGTSGYELWKSDGTVEGTALLKAISILNVAPKIFVEVVLQFGGNPLKTVLFFNADDGTTGRELWMTDGTTDGTVRVADINPGPAPSNPNFLTEVNGVLFFSAFHVMTGFELWRTRTMADGTVTAELVTDIRPGPSGSHPLHLTNAGGTLFFYAFDNPTATNTELWKHEPATGVTALVRDIYPGEQGSYPTDLTNVNGTLFFIAGDPVAGRELWRSDGTEGGTIRVTDIRPGSGQGVYNGSLTNVSGTLFFAGEDHWHPDSGGHGVELWKHEPATGVTALVKDIYPGSQAGSLNGSDPRNLTNVNGTLFFTAKDGISGRELWMSNGTPAGTVLVQDIRPGPGDSNPENLTVCGTLLFSADDGTTGRELWRTVTLSDRTVTALQVADINPGTGSSSPSFSIGAGDTVFFTADDGENGRELWKLAKEVAPDATGIGPDAVSSAEYRFPAALDPDVLGDRPTEIWAQAYWPTGLPAAPYPLVVFLHGNHFTCGSPSIPPYPPGIRIDDSEEYRATGVCTPPYEVVPNHLGYSYLAERLASWGYIVVSINTNRGINGLPSDGPPGDPHLILVRGRLVLKHLQRLSEWNTGQQPTPPSLGVDLLGQLDFSHVGLMGHSRGGEGMRAAYHLYREAGSPWPGRIPDPVTFKGIFEIAPTDRMSGQTVALGAAGVHWNVLLPICDGDVSDLRGVRPFDRMMALPSENPPAPKSTYTVWGANHNFYNTEWQLSDNWAPPSSPRLTCVGHMPIFPDAPGSSEQRQTALASVLAFFRGNVGAYADASFNQNFNLLFGLRGLRYLDTGGQLVDSAARRDRGFTPSPDSSVTAIVQDFSGPAGTNYCAAPNQCSADVTGIGGSVPRHDPDFRAARITWTSPVTPSYFEIYRTLDLSGYQALELRVARQPSALNPAGPTDFGIQLMADGGFSNAVSLCRYADLRGPVGGPDGLHPILQTVRIPLSDFANDGIPTVLQGIRFTFEGTATGAIYLSNLRFSTLATSGPLLASEPSVGSLGVGRAGGGSEPTLSGEPARIESGRSLSHFGTHTIKRIQRVRSAAALQGASGVEIELTSTRKFPALNAAVVLQLGERVFVRSRPSANADTGTLIFILSEEEFARTEDGDPVVVRYDPDTPDRRWDFGRLNKSLLDK